MAQYTEDTVYYQTVAYYLSISLSMYLAQPLSCIKKEVNMQCTLPLFLLADGEMCCEADTVVSVSLRLSH